MTRSIKVLKQYSQLTQEIKKLYDGVKCVYLSCRCYGKETDNPENKLDSIYEKHICFSNGFVQYNYASIVVVFEHKSVEIFQGGIRNIELSDKLILN